MFGAGLSRRSLFVLYMASGYLSGGYLNHWYCLSETSTNRRRSYGQEALRRRSSTVPTWYLGKAVPDLKVKVY